MTLMFVCTCTWVRVIQSSSSSAPSLLLLLYLAGQREQARLLSSRLYTCIGASTRMRVPGHVVCPAGLIGRAGDSPAGSSSHG